MLTDNNAHQNPSHRVDRAELDIASEDAGGLILHGFQGQSPIRFDSQLTFQSPEMITCLAALGVVGAQWQDTTTALQDTTTALAMLLGSLSDSEAKVSSPSQLLTATVDMLVGENKSPFYTSLTDEDHQRLVPALDKLIDVVGEDENHFLAPLMHFIGSLIEKYEEEMNMKTWKEPLNEDESKILPSPEAPLPSRGLESAYGDNEPEYTLDMLISTNPDYDGNNDKGEPVLRLPARGLQAAYSDDEPEYTLDMLVSTNPDYEA